MADLKQWVNLPKKNVFKTDGITSRSRLGAFRFKCTFKNEEPDTFKFRVIRTEPDPNLYSDTEMGRNRSFKVQRGKGNQRVDGTEVTFEKKITLAAAGGYEYKLQAKHQGKELDSTKTVETWRRLYYQVMTMNGCASGSLQMLTDDFTDAGTKYNIEFLKKGSDATIDLIKTITDDSDDALFALVKPKYELENLRPYSFVIVWVNYIADPGHTTVEYEGSTTRAHTSWSYDDATRALTVDVGEDLWYGLDDADDGAKRWFRDFSATVTRKDKSTASFNVGKHRAKVVGAARRTHGGHRKIELDLSGKVPDDMTRIDFKLKVRTIEGWSDGVSFNGTNLIVVATKVHFLDWQQNNWDYLVNHELGHKIGMVPRGTGPLPDAPTTFYEGRGHQGPHCTGGATYAHHRWSGNTTCVMFGGDEIPQPRTFCDQCAKIVRKLDLGKDMPGFRASVMDK